MSAKINMKLRVVDGYDVTTTVGELITALSSMDANMPVFLDGCCGAGNAVGLVNKGGSVLIENGYNEFTYNLDSDEPPTLNEPYKSRLIDEVSK